MNTTTTYPNARTCCCTRETVAAITVVFDDTEHKFTRGRDYRFDAAGEWVSILDEGGDEIARVSTRRLLTVLKAAR